MRVSVAALSVALALTGSAAMAETSQPFGKGFDGWSFNRTDEGKGVVNCRAFHRVGGRDDILAMRTDGWTYVSVRAEGRRGKYAESFIVPFREPRNGQQWDALAEANGVRLWFALPAYGIEVVATRGGYTLYLGGTEDREEVNLGKSALAAWKRVRECIVASGG